MTRKIVIGFLILLVVASFLRVHDLDKESLWSDESATVQDIDQDSLAGIMAALDINEFKPPLYFFSLHYWSKIWGMSEFSLRFFSALFGVLGIVSLFFLSRELFGNRVALFAAVIMALSPLQILYSQEIRSYTFFAFLTVTSFLFLARYIKNQKPHDLFFYGFFTLASLYSHYFTLFYVILQNLIISFTKKEIKFRFYHGQWVMAILAIPAFVMMINDMLYYNQAFLNSISAYFHINIVFLQSIGIFWFFIPFIALIILAFLFKKYFFYLKKIFLDFKNKKYGKTERIFQNFFIIFLIAFYLLYFTNLQRLFTPFFLTRYSFFMIPFLYISIAWGVMRIKPHYLKRGVVFIIIILFLLSLPFYYGTIKKEQWREAAAFVEENEQLNQAILFDAPYVQRTFDYYYSGNSTEIGLLADPLMGEAHFAKLRPELDNKQGVWLILSHNFKTDKLYLQLLQRSYTLQLQKKYKGIMLYYFKNEN